MKKILTLGLTITALHANAQFTAKLYANSNGDNSTSPLKQSNKVNSISRKVPYDAFSVAIRKEGLKKGFQEIELGTIFRGFSQTSAVYNNSNGTTFTATNVYKYAGFSARYERGKNILSGLWKKRECSFDLSHAAQFSNTSSLQVATTSSFFSKRNSSNKLFYQVIPRFKVDLSKKIIVDMNFTVNTIAAGFLSTDNANPSLPWSKETILFLI